MVMRALDPGHGLGQKEGVWDRIATETLVISGHGWPGRTAICWGLGLGWDGLSGARATEREH